MAAIKKILSPAKEKEPKKNAADALGSFLKTAHHYNDVRPESKIISSGSLILDSDIKIQSGMVLRLVGRGGEVGKAQPVWSNVLTPSGWTKIGELKIGDKIINSQGGVSEVLGVFPQGKKKINALKFSDNSIVHCCDEHLWFTRTLNDRKHHKEGSVKTTKELKESTRKRHNTHSNHSIPFVKPIEFGNTPNLPIDPYLMGLILGDGSFRQRYNIGFTSNDEELIKEFGERLPNELKLKKMSKNDLYNYRVHSIDFVKIFEEMGLRWKFSHEKFIPPQYLTANIKDRREILRGLMDTDGSARTGNGSVCEYSTTSPMLAEQVIFIAKSLGGKVKCSERQTSFTYKGEKKKGKKSFRVIMSFTDFCPFKLERKVKKYYNRTRLLEKYIVDIYPDGEDECVCIKTSAPDSLYITDGFNLTHNTSQAFIFAENYMSTMENSKFLLVKAEGRLSDDQKKRSGLKFVDTLDEWETGTVFVASCNVAEDVFDMLKNVLECGHAAGEHIGFIIDSMDGLILRDDLAKEMGNGGMVAGVPKLTKLFFRHLALPIAHYDSLGIMTGQYAAQIKLDTYTPNAPNQGSSSGGSAQQHQSDYVFEYQTVNQGDLILEKEKEKPDPYTNKIIGKYARIKILKSASNVSGQTYTVPIRKGQVGSKQIWREKEVADLIVAFEIAKKPSGSWFTFAADIIEEAKQKELEVPEKVQGMNGIYKLLEDPNIYEFFAAKIKEMISDE